MLFCISLPNFIEIYWATRGGVITSYQFFANIEWTQLRKTEHEQLQSCDFKGSMAVLVL